MGITTRMGGLLAQPAFAEGTRIMGITTRMGGLLAQPAFTRMGWTE